MIADGLRARKIEWGTRLISLLGNHSSRFVEYEFAGSNLPELPSTIADVGACGSLFAYRCAKKGYDTFAVDFKKYHEKHRNLTLIKADICKLPFSDNIFDAISCISTIEHVGLTAYGDPEHDDGDFLAIQELTRVIKNGGYLILTTPFGNKYHLDTWMRGQERIYDFNRLNMLFNNYQIVKESYYIPLQKKKWVVSTRDEACKVHQSYPRSNLCCLLLKKVSSNE